MTIGFSAFEAPDIEFADFVQFKQASKQRSQDLQSLLDGPSGDAEVIFEMPKIKQDRPKIAFEKKYL